MPAPLPAPDQRTLLGRLQAHQRSLHAALYISWATTFCATVALLFAIYHLRYRDVVYVTTSGIQPGGYVSRFTAEEFSRNFIHWLNSWRYDSVLERNSYLVPLICTEVQNTYQLLLDAEAKQAQTGRVTQQGNIQEIRLAGTTANSFTFSYRLLRVSTFLNVPSTFNETYELTVLHAPAPDGTRRLCVASHRRIG